ncbi:TRAP transporter small permease [Paracoccus subflavus]|uniref:TRAP transporter small permease n=1 Tax=Paracoccus subflavus TaxID=2528244 RepID=UPI0013EEF735|nr:TRAP transporter small permease [Paracoccus subflavus]
MSRLLAMHDNLSRATWYGAAIALGLVVAIFTYEVLSRYLLAAPTRWASDVVAFLLLATVFLAAPWLARTQGHVAVTILPDLLPPGAQRASIAAGYLIGAAVCFWATWMCVAETVLLQQRGTMTLTSFRIPKWWLMAVMSYGLLDCGLQFIRAAGARLADEGPTVSPGGAS